MSGQILQTQLSSVAWSPALERSLPVPTWGVEHPVRTNPGHRDHRQVCKESGQTRHVIADIHDDQNRQVTRLLAPDNDQH